MSLRINHNLSALNANRNLALTTAAQEKSMQKLSSGFRINSASDDPAGLVISEQFRAQIAGLNRAIQNSEGSITMIQTAEGALTEINSLLISMRELAIHAANEGFNDTDQLKADQAEIDNALKTIDRIASTTQFGTKKLIDGSKNNVATITSANSSGLTIKESGLTSGAHSISATRVSESSATLNTTSLGLSLANTDGDPSNLNEAVHQLDVLQASGAATKTSGDINLTDAFGNNLTLAAAATAAEVTSTGQLSGPVTVGSAGDYTFTLNYQEKGESVTGKQTLTITAELGEGMDDLAAKLQTQINLNTSLSGKITASASTGTAIMRIQAANDGAEYSVQADAMTTTAAATEFAMTGASSRGASQNTLDMTATTEANANNNQTVTVAANTYTSMSQLNTAIQAGLTAAFGTAAGSTDSDLVSSVVGNTIQFATRDEGSDYSVQNNAVAGTGALQNIMKLTTDTTAQTGIDALVSFDNYTSTITSVKYGSTSTATLYNKASGDNGRGSIDLVVGTAQNGLNTGNLLLDVKAAKFDVRIDGGPATEVTAGVDSTVYNADRSEQVSLNIDLTSVGGTETLNNTDQSLVFQVGPNVGQTVSIGLSNMSSGSLGKGIAGNMFTSLSHIDVTTSQGAQNAQSLIDSAINEVSTSRGKLGSFQKNSLESNLRNLRIAAQNLTASESQIRDTDMASEMSEFTKNQILVQAGTSMLAQANQMPQIVLSLFR